MLEQIRKCQKCNLCYNQKPLLDTERDCQIFWVGLSAKRAMSDIEVPLAPETNTGMLIKKIEETCAGIITYKTNLVKCLPLTDGQKLRYPNKKEMDCCFGHLLNEIHAMSPQIIFLLGERVYSTVGKNMNVEFDKWNDFDYHYREIDGIYYVPIHHPSYIYIYKRKRIDDYISGVEKIIHLLLRNKPYNS